MICRECGNEVSFGAAFCDYCGASVPKLPKKICPSCNAEWGADTEFCGNCGSKTIIFDDSRRIENDDVNAKKKCAQCGCELVIGAEFCGNCGCPVSGTKKPPEIVPETGVIITIKKKDDSGSSDYESGKSFFKPADNNDLL